MPGLQKSVSLELNWQWLCSNSYLSKHMIVLVKIIPWIFFCHMLIYFVVCSSPVISTLDSPWDLRPCTAPQQSQRLFPPCLWKELVSAITWTEHNPSCAPHFAFWRTLVQSSENCMTFCSCSPGASDSTPSPRPYSSGSPHANDLARLLVWKIAGLPEGITKAKPLLQSKTRKFLMSLLRIVDNLHPFEPLASPCASGESFWEAGNTGNMHIIKLDTDIVSCHDVPSCRPVTHCPGSPPSSLKHNIAQH